MKSFARIIKKISLTVAFIAGIFFCYNAVYTLIGLTIGGNSFIDNIQDPDYHGNRLWGLRFWGVLLGISSLMFYLTGGTIKEAMRAWNGKSS